MKKRDTEQVASAMRSSKGFALSNSNISAVMYECTCVCICGLYEFSEKENHNLFSFIISFFASFYLCAEKKIPPILTLYFILFFSYQRMF
jgi:hypothetical protein